MAAQYKSEKIGDVSPGPLYDSRHPDTWLEDMKLHLKIIGFYGIGIGEDTRQAGTDGARFSLSRRQR